MDHLRYCPMCLNRWYATNGCLVTILAALETAHAISGRLLRASQLSEPATPARFRPFLTAWSYSLTACAGSSDVFPKLSLSPAEVRVRS
eukprot:6263352-Amphidinium_carterae.1